jgi:hypothetical protein
MDGVLESALLQVWKLLDAVQLGAFQNATNGAPGTVMCSV